MQLFKKYKFKIPIMICFIIYLAGLFIGQGFKIQFLAILGSISLVLCFCFALFEISKIKVLIVIFFSVFLIEQIIAYGFDVKLLKVYESINNGAGMSYSIVSTIFPLMLAFMINYIHIKNLTKKVEDKA